MAQRLGSSSPVAPQGIAQRLRRLPWWVYALAVLLLYGGLTSLGQGLQGQKARDQATLYVPSEKLPTVVAILTVNSIRQQVTSTPAITDKVVVASATQPASTIRATDTPVASIPAVPSPTQDTVLPSTTTTATTATRDASGLSNYLDGVIKVTVLPTFTVVGEEVTAVGEILNTDTVAHAVNAQANFYSVPLDRLGDDPASYLVTAWYTDLTLAPGEKRMITVTAKYLLPDPILSVDFSFIGK